MNPTEKVWPVAGLLDINQAVLLVVDIQERLQPVIHDVESLIRQAETLIQGAQLLDIPIVVTEQYPKGLGHTAEPLKTVLPETTPYFEKAAFGSLGEPTVVEYLASLNRNQVMVCGVEAHVCVNQTVHQLLSLGYEAHLILDAISSRNPAHKALAIDKMKHNGAKVSCVEMALFELMQTARHPQFKGVQTLVK